MAQPSAAELATRERIRVALIGSRLETMSFKTLLTVAQQAPQIAKLFKPPQGGKEARGQLLTLVAWLLILVRSGAILPEEQPQTRVPRRTRPPGEIQEEILSNPDN